MVVEAVVRLLPGFVGNAESLVEESHEDGLLEYPVYTKPASWLDGSVVRPGQDGFTSAAQLYNPRFDDAPAPEAIHRAAC